MASGYTVCHLHNMALEGAKEKIMKRKKEKEKKEKVDKKTSSVPCCSLDWQDKHVPEPAVLSGAHVYPRYQRSRYG